MRREKRSAKVQAYLPDTLKAQLELFAEQDGYNVISLSAWLHQHLDEYATVRIAKQKIGRRAGNQ